MSTSHGSARPGRARKSVRAKVALQPTYVAFIADIVQSRRIRQGRRRDLQFKLESTMGALNSTFADHLTAKFLITIGDEFQGLLRDATPFPDIIRLLEKSLPDVDLRIGIGKGAIETEIREYAIGMDGPAWHAARAAIDEAKAKGRLGGVFQGFGEQEDLLLSGLARVLHRLRHELTSKQREILDALLAGEKQSSLAQRAGVTKQAISKQTRAAGWQAYEEGENALRVALTSTCRKAEA